MSEETKAQQTQTESPAHSTPEDKGGPAAKTFTQDEVNKIVAERLTRERTKDKPSEADQKAAELDNKEKELAKREMMHDLKSTISARGYSEDLLDVLKVNNPDELKTALRVIDEAFYRRADSEEPGKVRGATPVSVNADSALRKVFGLRTKGK